MDSSEMNITYKAIQDRAKQDALEYVPPFPQEDESWEDWQRDIEDLDSYDIAAESCDWDWVIYYGRAMELCLAVPSIVLNDAEEEWNETYGTWLGNIGLFELAVDLARIIVVNEIREAVDTMKEEMIELAESKIEQI